MIPAQILQACDPNCTKSANQEEKKNRNLFPSIMKLGFTDSSVGKGSACNAGDSSSISVLGRSAGEWIGYPPQYSWASLVA